MGKFSALMCMSQNRFLDVDYNSIPEEVVQKEQEILGQFAHWIFGRKTYEELGQGYFDKKTVWILTKANSYGWYKSTYKNRDNLGIVTDLGDLPDTVDYLVLGGRETFETFMPKLNEIYVFRHNRNYEGQVSLAPFEEKFQKSETILTNGEWEVILYTL